MQIIALINFVAAFQGLFLAYLLVNDWAHSKEHRVLAILVSIMSISLLGPVLGLTGYYKVWPHLMRIGDPMVFTLGPLIYLYLHLLTKGTLPSRYYWHFIPFVLYVVSQLPFYLSSGAEKITFGEKVFLNKQQSLFVVTIQIVRMLHMIAYVMASVFLLRNFEQRLKENYSDIDRLNLEKASTLLKLFVFVCVVGILVYLSSLFLPIHLVLANSLTGIALSGVIYALAYSTWKRPKVEVLFITVSANEQDKQRAVYHLSDTQVKSLSVRLKEVLEHRQLYLQNDISLNQLSAHLQIPPYQTSELIHREYGESFFDLINRLRIEEIKRRLQDPSYSHFSILGIAMDCGFNSKSSFNTAFKKFTGLTPSQYKEEGISA